MLVMKLQALILLQRCLHYACYDSTSCAQFYYFGVRHNACYQVACVMLLWSYVVLIVQVVATIYCASCRYYDYFASCKRYDYCASCIRYDYCASWMCFAYERAITACWIGKNIIVIRTITTVIVVLVNYDI